MTEEEMIRRLYILASYKDEDAIIEYPHHIPYFVYTPDDRDAIKKIIDLYWELKYKKFNILKEKIHQILDSNGITRAYQLEIDRYFDELWNKEEERL